MSEEKAERIAASTTLSWGAVSAPVGLIKVAGKPQAAPEFVKAGPHGQPLERAAVEGGQRVKFEEPAVEEPERVMVAMTGRTVEDPDDPLSVGPVAPLPPLEEGDESRVVTVGVVEEGYDKELAEEDVRRGMRTTVGEFIDLTDQLDAIDKVTKLEEMRITGFVRRERVPRIQIIGSYYLAATGPGAPKVLSLLHDAMHAEQRVAVVKWTKRTAQSLGVIIPTHEGLLVVLELEWHENCRMPGPRALAHVGTAHTAEEMEAACELLREMGESPDLICEQRDDRLRLRQELVKRTLEGKLGGFSVPEPPTAPEEADLAAQLRASALA